MFYTILMRIGIDGNEANVERKVGISEYSFELIKQFSFLKREDIFWKIYLKSEKNDDFPSISKNWTYSIFGPSKLWTQIALPLNLYKDSNRPHVFFSPGHYAPRFSPVPTVISIMDLAFFHFPEYFTKKDLTQLHNWTSYSVKQAKRVITISQATRSDIIKLYGITGEKISVIYPGIKEESNIVNNISMSEIKSKYNISQEYILFVGTLQPRKNIEKLIESFSLLLRKNESENTKLQLVIVGKKGWKYESILSAPKRFGISERVKFLDFVPDEELASLYRHAQLFVFPSLYEGFGLPVLEAMKHGCPVLTSNISSLPEAGGDAAIYCDPENSKDIAEKIEKIIKDSSLRKEMIEKGYKHIKNFSWEKAAKQTLAVLEEVGNNNK